MRRELEHTQWYEEQRLERLREARLGRFLQQAAQHVAYYRDLFSACGFRPQPIMPVAALGELPFLDKPTIRAHGERLKSAHAGPLKPYNTGGSSGEPLRFWVDRQRVSHDVAAKWRATRWWGVDIGDPEIVVWGSPIELGTQDRVRQFRDRLLRTRLLSAFALDDSTLDQYLDVLRHFRPRMLFGYPSALAQNGGTWPPARAGAGSIGYRSGIRHFRAAVCRPARPHRTGVWLPSGQWLRCAGLRFRSPRVHVR
jgi:phenylacetate-CoA ligase